MTARHQIRVGDIALDEMEASREVGVGELAELRHAGVLERAVLDDAAEGLGILRNRIVDEKP